MKKDPISGLKISGTNRISRISSKIN